LAAAMKTKAIAASTAIKKVEGLALEWRAGLSFMVDTSAAVLTHHIPVPHRRDCVTPEGNRIRIP
jgi:hypothetical protein